MKVTGVTTYVLKHDLPEPFGFSQGWYSTRKCLLTKVQTDEGLFGWGESWGPPEPVCTIIEHILAPMVVGEDPFDSERLWERMYNSTRDYGQKGLIIGAISSIDIALWDIKGKALDLPVHKLLGGAFRDHIKAYASSFYQTNPPQSERDLRELALKHINEGFTMMKMKIGFGPAEDVKRVRAVREAVGEGVGLMVDANHAYDSCTAIRLGKQIEPYDIFWFEEPVGPENIEGYLEVRAALNIPIAGGEAEFTKFGFRALISKRAVDIIQPDVTLAGGFTECKKIAAMAQAWHIACVPHVWGSAVGLAAGLQFITSIPNHPEYMWSDKPVLEVDRSPNPLRDELAREPIVVVKNGVVSIPQRPGLGVDVDEQVLDRYRVK